MFGANIKSKITYFNNNIRYRFFKTNKLQWKYSSAQVKSCIILSALNTPVDWNKLKISRNHTELMLKYLNYP